MLGKCIRVNMTMRVTYFPFSFCWVLDLLDLVGKWCTQGVVWKRKGTSWSKARGGGTKTIIERCKWSVCSTIQWSPKGVEGVFYVAVRSEGIFISFIMFLFLLNWCFVLLKGQCSRLGWAFYFPWKWLVFRIIMSPFS